MSKRSIREWREENWAAYRYAGPFENKWLITGPDTMAAGQRRLLRALVIFHGYPKVWPRAEFLKRYAADPMGTFLKVVYNDAFVTRLATRESPFLRLLSFRH